MQEKTNKAKDTIITPQYITVKEELLGDFFDLCNFFANWQSFPNSSDAFNQWINKLKALYLKVRSKVRAKGETRKYKHFLDLANDMDTYLLGQKQEVLKVADLVKWTLGLTEYIESTGITSVETEPGDPIADFIYKGFPQ